MINFITLTNDRGDKLEVDMRRPELSGFLILSPDGITPVNGSISTDNYADGIGAVYKSGSVGTRAITIPFRFFEPNDLGLSIEDLRMKFYRLFQPLHKINVQIEGDQRTGGTEGWIESAQTVIFSDTCGGTLSIVCPDPFFTKNGANKWRTIDNVTPVTASDQNGISIANDGDTDIGVLIEVVKESIYDDTNREISVRDDNGNNIVFYTGAYPNPSGGEDIAWKKFCVDSRRHNHRAYVVDQLGNEYNALNWWKPDSPNGTKDWPFISMGGNKVYVNIDEPDGIYGINIKYQIKYMGV